MTFFNILVFAAVSLAAGALPRARSWLLCIASVLAVYWLQPALPVRNLDFWLPTASITLAAAVWIVTAQKRVPAGEAGTPAGSAGSRPAREDWTALAAIGLTISALALTRYLGPDPILTPARPPEIGWVLSGLVIGMLILGGLWMLAPRRWLPAAGILVLLALFAAIKTDPFAQAAAAMLRRLAGQSAQLASPLDIRWLGFSYLAFRLIHALRDRMTGRLPDTSLREFITYGLFFPAVTAGPIDRLERFVKDLRSKPGGTAGMLTPGAERVLAGVFKKFVLADGLAILALNAALAARVAAPHWMWFFLYAYALRIYFDFSGYTDIALGLGRWAGVTLPENFNRPYLQPNLTAFWNSWHITLAQWFRSYLFNPLTRALRSGPRPWPIGLVILAGQFATMTLIGLWHGVTWNFLIWGCWHGFGLFLHNRWGERSRAWMPRLEKRPLLKKAYTVASTLATFHYVVLGWVWFALPTVESSSAVFLRLFGISN
ncbi:MAG: MBOAT family protein [Anaerolineales bacterium]|nr:MBOAT family protein [Anaerolineales bacterium]